MNNNELLIIREFCKKYAWETYFDREKATLSCTIYSNESKSFKEIVFTLDGVYLQTTLITSYQHLLELLG